MINEIRLPETLRPFCGTRGLRGEDFLYTPLIEEEEEEEEEEKVSVLLCQLELWVCALGCTFRKNQN